MLYILKISLVTYIFKLNSLKSATKAINLASFKEIQWQIILFMLVKLKFFIQELWERKSLYKYCMNVDDGRIMRSWRSCLFQ
jgi:hypothetical protein